MGFVRVHMVEPLSLPRLAGVRPQCGVCEDKQSRLNRMQERVKAQFQSVRRLDVNIDVGPHDGGDI